MKKLAETESSAVGLREAIRLMGERQIKVKLALNVHFI
jgi:hypothetical protein